MPDETMRAELAPCPFCGRTDLLGIEEADRGFLVVTCRACGAKSGSARSETPQEALAAWNRRASAAPGGEPVAVKLMEALEFYADRDHFHLDPDSDWEDCSGEPSNFLWRDESQDMIEDGSVARAALEGIGFKMTPTQYKAALAEVERLVKLDPVRDSEEGAVLDRLSAEIAAHEAIRYPVAPPSDAGQRVALTDEQIGAEFARLQGEEEESMVFDLHDFRSGVQWSERHHGIRAAISESEGGSACPK